MGGVLTSQVSVGGVDETRGYRSSPIRCGLETLEQVANPENFRTWKTILFVWIHRDYFYFPDSRHWKTSLPPRQHYYIFDLRFENELDGSLTS